MASVKGTDYSYYASYSELLSCVTSLPQLQLTLLTQGGDGELNWPASNASTAQALISPPDAAC